MLRGRYPCRRWVVSLSRTSGVVYRTANSGCPQPQRCSAGTSVFLTDIDYDAYIHSSNIWIVFCAQVYCGQCIALLSMTIAANYDCERRHSLHSYGCGPNRGGIAQESYRRLRDMLPMSSGVLCGLRQPGTFDGRLGSRLSTNLDRVTVA